VINLEIGSEEAGGESGERGVARRGEG